MAGIGVKLNKIYNKNTLTTNIIGMGYSTMITIAPMILVIAAIMAMQVLLEVSKVGYAQRELFACTVLYIFIFALLGAAPFNSVLSRYMSDIIYEEKYDDVLPCFYVGMMLNLGVSCGMVCICRILRVCGAGVCLLPDAVPCDMQRLQKDFLFLPAGNGSDGSVGGTFSRCFWM